MHHNLVKYNMIYGGQGLVNDGVFPCVYFKFRVYNPFINRVLLLSDILTLRLLTYKINV